MSYQKGLQAVFVAAIFLTVIGIIAALFMRDIDLNAPVQPKVDEEAMDSDADA